MVTREIKNVREQNVANIIPRKTKVKIMEINRLLLVRIDAKAIRSKSDNFGWLLRI